ncbi:hypothetical protein LCGC14_1653090 [marine sediment metagenome]|uniref:Tyr recombinase domain-containing protein n=1 Tax=marine sediment metagenome TaxID=412755 RepID=A0A0F9HWA8_9ZZZZ
MDKTDERLYLSLLNEIPSLHRRRVSLTKISQTAKLAESLAEFEKINKIEIFVKEVQLNDIIEFGYYIKEQKKLSNSSVVTYLTTVITHLRDKGTEILRRKVIKEFPYSQENIPTLTEDIVQAILDTQVQDKYRPVLDAIKLILLHGFRYSDLWVLEKHQCIHQTDTGIKYIKYFPPKNRNSIKNRNTGVTVSLHPIGEQIIKYWQDRRTLSVFNENRAPKNFKDKELYPHLIYCSAPKMQPFFKFVNPIIPIPHHFLDRSVKHAIFKEVNKVWLVNNFYVIKHLNPGNLGLLSIVPGTKKELWETLSYHTFRHVYCSRYLSKGGNLLDLRDNVGHSSIAVTQKYAHTIEAERLERAVKIMDY